MDEAQRNKRLVLDAYSGRSGALMTAIDPDVEYTLMGSTHRFARTSRGRDDVVQNLFAEVRAVLASGRKTPVNAIAEGEQVVVEFEGEGRTRTVVTTTTATAMSSASPTDALPKSASTSTRTWHAR